MDEDAIRALLCRLARPHPSGGQAIERAALLAAGGDFPQVMAWIDDHHGRPESAATATVRRGGGLHGARISGGGDGGQPMPLRYVLEAGVLT